jgi:hypothetical protein
VTLLATVENALVEPECAGEVGAGLVALAKASPGKRSFSSQRRARRIAGEMKSMAASTCCTPYKGGAMMNDLSAPLSCSSMSSALAGPGPAPRARRREPERSAAPTADDRRAGFPGSRRCRGTR